MTDTTIFGRRRRLLVIAPVSIILLISGYACAAESGKVKQPNVSGVFYPDDPRRLSTMTDNFISAGAGSAPQGPVRGIICPHAGYIYSGPVAGYAYNAIKGKPYKTVVILAPSHYVLLSKAAVYAGDSFRTPLGDIPVDRTFISALLKQTPIAEYNNAAFEKEHSAEVQLPFLQRSLGKIAVVPILLGSGSYESCVQLADALVKVIGARNDVLIVASSDLSHFHDRATAKTIDAKTMDLIKNNDSRALFKANAGGECELCGAGAVLTLMLAMQQYPATAITRLSYATSADTAGADPDRVVGYSSFIFTQGKDTRTMNTPNSGKFTLSQKKELLSLARKAITEFVQTGKRITLNNGNDPLFSEHRGAFVTIKIDNELRGCIGRIVADEPLAQVVRDMAIEAATGDPRFPPLQKAELTRISLEISVLSPIAPVTDINDIIVGVHGLIIRKGFNSGLLLPQVASEYHWTREEFLQHTCLKAGLAPDAWKNNASLYSFSAEVFGEEEGLR